MGLFKSKTPPKNSALNSRFIVIDGPADSNKAEQIELLQRTLEVSGYDSEFVDFPLEDGAATLLLEKYHAGDYGELNVEAAAIIYALDRLDASSKIKQLLSAGKIVITNRYITSNAAHQGINIADKDQRIKFYRWLDMLEYGIFNLPKPDLNIILYSGNNSDADDAQQKVFYEIAELFPNTRLIECINNNNWLPQNQIHAKVWELVRRIALKGIDPKY